MDCGNSVLLSLGIWKNQIAERTASGTSRGGPISVEIQHLRYLLRRQWRLAMIHRPSPSLLPRSQVCCRHHFKRLSFVVGRRVLGSRGQRGRLGGLRIDWDHVDYGGSLSRQSGVSYPGDLSWKHRGGISGSATRCRTRGSFGGETRQ